MTEEEAPSGDWAAQIEASVRRAESLTDPEAKRVVLDLLETVMAFHAAALDRILEIVSASDGGAPAIEAIAKDGLTSSILLLHDLHPDDFAIRIQRAVDKLRHRLHPRGADITLLGFADGIVRVRYQSPRNGQVAAAKSLIEDAIFELAPDTVEVAIEGLKEELAQNGFVPLASLLAGQST